MMDTSEGAGTIEFFETREEANVTYTKEVANILIPQQEKAAKLPLKWLNHTNGSFGVEVV